MKETLLKLFAVETIVMFVLRLFHGITAEQFGVAQAKVRGAEIIYPNPGSGEAKKAWVTDELKDLFPKLANFAVDLLIQMALSYLTKKGALR